MQVSFPEDVTERLAAKASEWNLRPEEVVKFIIETTFQASPSEIDQEVEQDPELLASLQCARKDIRAGRVVSHDEVLDWHRHHPE